MYTINTPFYYRNCITHPNATIFNLLFNSYICLKLQSTLSCLILDDVKMLLHIYVMSV